MGYRCTLAIKKTIEESDLVDLFFFFGDDLVSTHGMQWGANN